jgi:hypothetical protein
MGNPDIAVVEYWQRPTQPRSPYVLWHIRKNRPSASGQVWGLCGVWEWERQALVTAERPSLICHDCRRREAKKLKGARVETLQEAIAALPEANMEWEEITGKSPYCDYCLAILPGIHEVSCKAP